MLLRGHRRAIRLAPCKYGPGDPGIFVGDRHGDHSRRLALKQASHPDPRRRCVATGASHHRGGADDQKPAQISESLKDTADRLLPYWHEEIEPMIRQDKCVLIVAHGNSLRALIKHLDRVSDADVSRLEIPTGIPLIYELDESLRPTREYYGLAAREPRPIAGPP